MCFVVRVLRLACFPFAMEVGAGVGEQISQAALGMQRSALEEAVQESMQFRQRTVSWGDGGWCMAGGFFGGRDKFCVWAVAVRMRALAWVVLL